MMIGFKSLISILVINALFICSQLTAHSSSAVIEIELEKGVVDKKGTLDETSAIELLRAAYKQGALTRGEASFPSPQCLKAKNISSQSGLKTLALFAILASKKCLGETTDEDDYKLVYILKEMQDAQEPDNLDAVKNNSHLRKLDMRKNKEEGLPSISFHHELISFTDKKGRTHALAILDAAPGKELHALVANLAELRRAKRDSSGADFDTQAKNLKNAFYQVGRALGKMHHLFMEPPGAIFGKTYVHGDLHDRNVFVDGSNVTLIDNESFVHSLNEKKPVWVDLLRLLNPVYNPKAEKHHPKEFKPSEWIQLSVTPLFQGYVDGYPSETRVKVKEALKKMFLSDSEATNKILEQYGNKHLKEVRDTYLQPALSAVQ